jgi:Tol biopolymer transport system component
LSLLVVASAGCGGPGGDPGGEPEVVYTVQPPTWFEDGWSYGQVSPNGQWLLFGARFGLVLVNRASAAVSAADLHGDLDQVRSAVFLPDSRMARLGRLGDREGWFFGGADGSELSALPPDALPRFSRDGARVAFTRGAGGRGTDLWIGTLREFRVVSLDGPVSGLEWSHDGEGVYALVERPDGLSDLMRVSARDGSVLSVRESLDATWRFNSIGVSPDGSSLFLALVGTEIPDLEDRHRPGADRDLDIYRIDLRTGELEGVVATPGDDFYPHVVGEHLYWTHNDFFDAVALVPVSGGEPRVLVTGGQIPYWSPDGRQIAFTYGGWRVADWALNLDAGVIDLDEDAQPVSEMRVIVEGYHEDFTPAWSPDGRWLVYHSHRSGGPVASYAAEGSTDDLYLRATSAPLDEEIRLTDFGWEVGMADWAPDGRRLVFDSWDRGGRAGVSRPWIATLDPESGRATRVERLPLPEGFGSTLLAAWSPVSDEIAVVERLPGARQAIWIVTPEGSRPERLVEFESSTYGGVDWTPDGAHLLFAALAEGRMQLFTVDRSGNDIRNPSTLPRREVRQLTWGEADLIHPQVSPDGRWIAASRLIHRKEVRRIPLP